jgi:glyoxylase-like metal-dependent hydrolase (beta-lactamase superfamily II)
MGKNVAILSRVVILTLTLAGSAFAQQSGPNFEPFPPFHIAGNLYYVGSSGLANYLITTPEGNILINSDLEANVPMIKLSIEKLGFKFSDTKILLISHAHWDHDAGSAAIKEATGANLHGDGCGRASGGVRRQSWIFNMAARTSAYQPGQSGSRAARWR